MMPGVGVRVGVRIGVWVWDWVGLKSGLRQGLQVKAHPPRPTNQGPSSHPASPRPSHPATGPASHPSTHRPSHPPTLHRLSGDPTILYHRELNSLLDVIHCRNQTDDERSTTYRTVPEVGGGWWGRRCQIVFMLCCVVVVGGGRCPTYMVRCEADRSGVMRPLYSSLSVSQMRTCDGRVVGRWGEGSRVVG